MLTINNFTFINKEFVSFAPVYSHILEPNFFGKVAVKECFLHIDLIIPLFDNSSDLLNIHREEIEKFGTKIGLPGKNQYELARNKGLLMEFCRKNNISHPLTVHISKNNYENVAELVGFPSLLKPDNSSGAVGIIHLN